MTNITNKVVFCERFSCYFIAFGSWILAIEGPYIVYINLTFLIKSI